MSSAFFLSVSFRFNSSASRSAAFLTTNSKFSKYGWVLFLTVNIATILFAPSINKNGLLVSQIGFTCTSLLGLWRTGLIGRATEKQQPCQTLPLNKHTRLFNAAACDRLN